jgi:hypothetical protein
MIRDKNWLFKDYQQQASLERMKLLVQLLKGKMIAWQNILSFKRK